MPQNQEAFDALAVNFLDEQGFPVTEAYQAFFAANIQALPNDDDTFDPVALAKAMRRARVNELAFYLIHPSKRPQPEVKDVTNEAVKEAPVGVE